MMALQTCTVDKMIILISTAKARGVIKIIATMVHMAVKAKITHPVDHQVVMTAAVWGMANSAVLLHWRMFPYPGTAFIGMTCVTELIGAFRIDHMF